MAAARAAFRWAQAEHDRQELSTVAESRATAAAIRSVVDFFMGGSVENGEA